MAVSPSAASRASWTSWNTMECGMPTLNSCKGRWVRRVCVQMSCAYWLEIRADGEEESGMRDSTTTLVEEEEDVCACGTFWGAATLSTHMTLLAHLGSMGAKEGRRIVKGVARMSGLGSRRCCGGVEWVVHGSCCTTARWLCATQGRHRSFSEASGEWL
ncbi:hypothetical protein BC830DRAFT_1105704 [Chytriomyces sp. MP71]|nr:hypothetical protein BC830DRAFT_1105704 [Chytriomyces sp. MP71]